MYSAVSAEMYPALMPPSATDGAGRARLFDARPIATPSRSTSTFASEPVGGRPARTLPRPGLSEADSRRLGALAARASSQRPTACLFNAPPPCSPAVPPVPIGHLHRKGRPGGCGESPSGDQSRRLSRRGLLPSAYLRLPPGSAGQPGAGAPAAHTARRPPAPADRGPRRSGRRRFGRCACRRDHRRPRRRACAGAVPDTSSRPAAARRQIGFPPRWADRRLPRDAGKAKKVEPSRGPDYRTSIAIRPPCRGRLASARATPTSVPAAPAEALADGPGAILRAQHRHGLRGRRSISRYVGDGTPCVRRPGGRPVQRLAAGLRRLPACSCSSTRETAPEAVRLELPRPRIPAPSRCSARRASGARGYHFASPGIILRRSSRRYRHGVVSAPPSLASAQPSRRRRQRGLRSARR